jgi:tRNA (guanine37-N1)-methyltransferase
VLDEGSEMWRATVLTLFPEMFPGPLGASLIGKALSDGIWSLDVRDIRDSGIGRHRSVDDTPSGGGPGMVMRADVAAAAIDAARSAGSAANSTGRPLIYLSPRGKPLTQARVRDFAAGAGVILFCGRFEGLDERAIEARQMEEISIGDFVLSGGEIAGCALIEAAVRLLPGVLGAETSKTEESFEQGLLEYPHYTRPQSFEGREIPPVLNSGNHGQIAGWRRAQSEALTRERRPDLWTLYEKLARSARRPASSDRRQAKGLPKDAKNEHDPDA